jgi:lipoprotein-releasing system ATP-binding protein
LPHSAAPGPSAVLLEARQLRKTYRKADVAIPVLRGVDFAAHTGQFTAVVGQSGSGKSTLLHLLGTLDSADSGQIYFEGHRIDQLSAAGREVLRNRHFGMIFQFYHLLPELSTLENVLLPVMIAHGTWSYWRSRRQLRDRARQLIQLVGLEHRMRHKPRELSGGEMQRVAIARALITRPRLLLADEPTGNLDRHTGQGILDTLCSLNERENLTIVMVTHDHGIAQRSDRVVQLVEGQLQGSVCL